MPGVDGIRLLLTIGAAARLTRLTTRDKITEPARKHVHRFVLFSAEQRRAESAGKAMPAPKRPWEARFRIWLHTLITCDWCVGFWWSAVLGLFAHRKGDRAVFQVPAGILTAAYALGLLVEHESPRPPVVLSQPAPSPKTRPESPTAAQQEQTPKST